MVTPSLNMADSRLYVLLKAHLKRSRVTVSHMLGDVVLFVKECYPSLDIQEVDEKWLIVSCSRFVFSCDATISPQYSLGPLKPIRIVFHSEGNFTVEILMSIVSSGTWKGVSTPYSSVLDYPTLVFFYVLEFLIIPHAIHT